MSHFTIHIKKHFLSSILFLLSIGGYLLTLIAPHYRPFMEQFYSLGINYSYRQMFSRLFGLFPFSVYEFLLYGVILIILCDTLYLFYKLIRHHQQWKKLLFKWFWPLFNFAMFLWCLFVYTWALNYARLPLESVMHLERPSQDSKALAHLYDHLITRLNMLSDQVTRDNADYMTISGGYRDVFDHCQICYDALSKDYPEFKGEYGTPKPIVLSGPMCYTGITGIYSPFTCEANINTAILPQDLLSTTLHEMAHQRGYAPEDESNFIAALAASYSPDVNFKYSGYLLALAYTNAELKKMDPALLTSLNARLNEQVISDLRNHNAFWQKYEGRTQKISSTLNDHYLKANGVTDGEASYGRMVQLLLAYYQTHPDF